MGDQEAGKSGKIPIKLILLLVIIMIAGGGGYFAYTTFLAPDKAEQADEVQAGEGENDIKMEADLGPIFHMSPFIVNLLDNDGKRYLKATVDLEMSDEKTRVEVEKKLPLLRDSLLFLLSNKQYADIRDINGKIKLKEEMEIKLNSLMVTGKIRKVYFTDFVIQ